MQGGAGYKGYAKLELGNLDTPVPPPPSKIISYLGEVAILKVVS